MCSLTAKPTGPLIAGLLLALLAILVPAQAIVMLRYGPRLHRWELEEATAGSASRKALAGQRSE